MKFSCLIVFVISSLLISCSSSGSQVVITNESSPKMEMLNHEEPLKYDAVLEIETNSVTKISRDIDLGGKIFLIPKGVTLIPMGGVIKNGTLIGNRTKIEGDKTLFDKVHIQGTWNKVNISTDLFASLDYENSLCDVFALASHDVKNTIEIKDGEYWVSTKPFQSCLNLRSNTILIIDGTVKLMANNFKGCDLLGVKKVNNVVIKGSGNIVGDKKEHKGTEGEWGHGICVLESRNVIIQDLNINNCWGDCVYVGGKSVNISIRNCRLNEGRRQGISVTSADSVLISKCNISNVYGTAPQYGIDIEPNKGDNVDNITIEDVVVSNCYGGIMSWRPDDAVIGSIIMRRCTVTNAKVAHPVHMRFTDRVVFENCEVMSETEDCILVESVDTLSAYGNIMISRNKDPFVARRVKVKDMDAQTIIVR